MNSRTTHVDAIEINTVSYSSTLEIGDAQRATPLTNVIAVQKEGGIHSDEGFEFAQFPIFNRRPHSFDDTETVEQHHFQHHPNIYVENISIIGVSSSSIIQLGNLRMVDAESRIKHIRILQEEQNEES